MCPNSTGAFCGTFSLYLFYPLAGIGKTTLVCSVCQILQERHHIELHGFYTEEVRVGGAGRRGTRVGFDVVCFDGKRGPLARTEG